MTKDLFVPYRSHLPQHIQDDFEEDEVWMLRSDVALEDLITGDETVTNNRRYTFEEFHSFAENRVVFITPNTAISIRHDTPSQHSYTVDAIVEDRTLHISGSSADETSPALNFLFRLILESSRSEKNTNDGEKINKCINMTLKCFPMTPRQHLGLLDLSPLKNKDRKRKIASLTPSSSHPSSHTTIDIDFRFLALRQEHCKLIFNEYSHIFSCIKLSQCEIDGWTMNKNNEDQKSHDKGSVSSNERERSPQKLVLSCTQHEFRKFGEGRLWMSNETCIRELHLILHFMLADSDLRYLTSILENCKSLKSLSIELMDLDDKPWSSICKDLHKNQNLKRIQLSYTENFADSYRRLTPERRRSRTNDILELLKVNKALEEVLWPKIQQDDSLIPNIERLLLENKRRSSCNENELVN